MVETNTNSPAKIHEHLLKNVAEGVLVLDDHGIVTSANETAAKILGYKPETLIGRSCDIFWPKDLPPAQRLGFGETVHEGTNLRQSDGDSVPVNLTITPISDHIPSSTMISFTSMSDMENMNAALSHTQRMAGLGILTASVAHELNTPLSIIAATCGNLQHEVEDNSLSMDQLLKYIEMIEQSAWRSAKIVEVLRNYSYDNETITAVTDLNMIVEDALTLVHHQFRGEYNIEIDRDFDPDLKTIMCDHNGMTQVMINLLINARDAMTPGGGKVIVKTWRMSPENIKASLNGSAMMHNNEPVEYYAVSVTDTGCSVNEEIIDKIYDPFFTTKSKGKGTGLGLFIAKRILSQHNGRIWMQNNPEGGATFTIALPKNLVEQVEQTI